MEEEIPSLEKQFCSFSQFHNPSSDGTRISLYQSDYWLRQARILEDRKLTMTDTGIIWQKYNKTELTIKEWSAMLEDICETKGLKLEQILAELTNCGQPGTVRVNVPQYRLFFDTYRPKTKLINADPKVKEFIRVTGKKLNK